MQEFGNENKSKEVAFQAGMTAVNQAASEQELDERVGSALSSLDGSALLLPLCSRTTAVLQYVQQLISTQDRSNLHLMLCGAVSLAHAFQTGLQFILMLCIATPRAPAFQSRLECVYKLVHLNSWRSQCPPPMLKDVAPAAKQWWTRLFS